MPNEFLEQFPYVIKHKQGKANVVADGHSRRHAFPVMLEIKLFGFKCVKNLYLVDDDFKESMSFVSIQPMDVSLGIIGKKILKMHEKKHANMEKNGEKYAKHVNKSKRERVFLKGDLVWVHLRKEKSPTLRKSKLLHKGDRSFKIVKRINDNAYILNMPQEYGGNASFNVSDLSLC
ncbi:hypothetical protein CR513_05241, partial [Mucuna pruriens]